jgi:hypothetical protein
VAGSVITINLLEHPEKRRSRNESRRKYEGLFFMQLFGPVLNRFVNLQKKSWPD